MAKGVTDPKEIFKKTGGGYVGRDGKFRFDLDDRDAKLKVNPDDLEFDTDTFDPTKKRKTKTILLTDILDFPELYKQYYKRIKVGDKQLQALKNIKVILNYGGMKKDVSDTGTTLGYYRPSFDFIVLNMDELKNPTFNAQQQADYTMSTLIHEVQHAVQRREGFDNGISPDTTKDIILDAIDEDGVYKSPFDKSIEVPYLSVYNINNANSAYLNAQSVERTLKDPLVNTGKFNNLADNISDDIIGLTGDRKIDFIRTFEKVLDLKNRFKLTEEKAVKQQKDPMNTEISIDEILDIFEDLNNNAIKAFKPSKSDSTIPLLKMPDKFDFYGDTKTDLLNHLFDNFLGKSKKAKDFALPIEIPDVFLARDINTFIDNAYDNLRKNINLKDSVIDKIEQTQKRLLKDNLTLLKFKEDVDFESMRLYRDEYGEMEARLVEQRYKRRQELRRDPMLLTDEQITEKMLDDTGAIFREPDAYGRTTKILGGFKKGQNRNLAKGGDMKKQMDLFQEGGLKDEGGTVDPVSGNDVPPGSTQEEVRDDIPAQLSEGEFVFPADVVRFLGLNFLMELRQKAKAGLKRMEEMGQMGNSDEATLPDDIPFTIDDLDMEDELEYNEGGVVKAQTGTFVAPGAGVTTMPSQFAGQQLPSAGATPSYTVPTIPPPVPAPVGGFRPLTTSAQTGQQATGTTPTFQTLIGRKPGQYDEFREYVNEAGMKLQIPFKDGQPIYPIPEGYTFVDPEEVKVEDPKVTDVKPQTTKVVEQEGGDDPDPNFTSAVDLLGDPLSYKSIFNMDKLDTALKDIAFNQINLFDPKEAISRGIGDRVNVSEAILAGQRATLAGFKGDYSEKYGKNFNLANMDQSDRDDLANRFNNKAEEIKDFVVNKFSGEVLTMKGLQDRFKELGMKQFKATGNVKQDRRNLNLMIAEAAKRAPEAEERALETIERKPTQATDTGTQTYTQEQFEQSYDPSTDYSSGDTGDTGFGAGQDIGTDVDTSGYTDTSTGLGVGATGGFFTKSKMTKQKPKVKKMKRGGLASRK